MSEQNDNTEVQTEQPVITIQDLDLAAKIIAAAIERGAIKAIEAEEVGKVWKKIAGFVSAASGQLEASAEAATEASENELDTDSSQVGE